jgi:hypothetical protein
LTDRPHHSREIFNSDDTVTVSVHDIECLAQFLDLLGREIQPSWAI